MKNAFRWMIAVLLLGGLPEASLGGEIPPASADEPRIERASMEQAARYLDAVALDWTRQRQCGTCHTNYAYMIARPVLGAVGDAGPMQEVRGFFERRAEHWDDAEEGAAPRWDAEVVATAVALAINDAATTGRLHPATRKALDRMWALQRDDGGFDWLKCGWPPLEHDDYYGAVFAALGVGLAPDDYAKSPEAARGVERLRKYLSEHEPPDPHHRTFLLWASLKLDGLMGSNDREPVKDLLRSLQRPDGGWSLASLGDWNRRDGSPNPKDGPSDGYATGLVVYVLRQAGVPAEDPAIRRGAAWLEANQRASGRWFTRSLNNDKAHYIANAGTGFAVMALAACR
jgi:squalene-hopene/tetraprenyl-beta-curcumene cyclase